MPISLASSQAAGTAAIITSEIFAHARVAPTSIAFVHDGVAVTYRDFAYAILLAREYLQACEIKRGSIAIVGIRNLRDAWIVLLALRSLGVHTMAVNAAEQIAHLTLADVCCVVTASEAASAHFADMTAQRGWQDIRLPDDVFARSIDGLSLDDPTDPAPGGHAMLTSGTTGNNKMVLVGSDAETQRAMNLILTHELTKRSVMYLGAIGAWTAGGFNRPIAAWRVGGQAIFEQRPEARHAFLQGPTTDATLTITTLAELLQTLPANMRRRDDMNFHIVGGALPWPIARLTIERITRRLYNNLGSTEAGTIASTLIEKPGDQQWYDILPHRHVEIVDAADKPLPRGEMGFVRVQLLGGDVAGYHGDDAASRDFFRDGFFYPGDLGLFAANGKLTLLGRVTDVLTVNGGDKIAAAPIEQRLQDELSVTGACLFNAPSPSGGEGIHIAIETDRALAPDDIRAALGSVPFSGAIIHLVPALPRNDMGKIDRIVLRQSIAAALAQAQSTAKRT